MVGAYEHGQKPFDFYTRNVKQGTFYNVK